jgi:hypothetical protein
MEQQAGPLGLSGKAWGIIGIAALAAVALLICAAVLLAFGVDVGGAFS